MVCRQCNRTFRCEVRKRDQHRNHWGHRSHQSLLERGEGDRTIVPWGHLEVILLLLLEKFAGQYPVYQNLFFKEIILKKHAEKYGIATAFWMLLTVLECWNVHSSWKSDGRISRAVCWMRESQCATKWCAHVISPLHATLKFSWWHVDDTVSFRFRYSNYGLYIYIYI